MGIDPFHLSRCHTATTNQSQLQSSTTPPKRTWGGTCWHWLCVLRSDQTESVWMPTDLVKFLVHSICLLRKKLQHLAGRCHYYFYFFRVRQVSGRRGAICTCNPEVRAIHMYVCVLGRRGGGGMHACMCACMHTCPCVCVCAGDCGCEGVVFQRC